MEDWTFDPRLKITSKDLDKIFSETLFSADKSVTLPVNKVLRTVYGYYMPEKEESKTKLTGDLLDFTPDIINAHAVLIRTDGEVDIRLSHKLVRLIEDISEALPAGKREIFDEATEDFLSFLEKQTAYEDFDLECQATLLNVMMQESPMTAHYIYKQVYFLLLKISDSWYFLKNYPKIFELLELLVRFYPNFHQTTYARVLLSSTLLGATHFVGC